jgi:hypothetical protein
LTHSTSSVKASVSSASRMLNSAMTAASANRACRILMSIAEGYGYLVGGSIIFTSVERDLCRDLNRCFLGGSG